MNKRLKALRRFKKQIGMTTKEYKDLKYGRKVKQVASPNYRAKPLYMAIMKALDSWG